jgi:hypothetical protein
MGIPGFAGELTPRHFNLTHECGMELIYYLVLSQTDFQGWSCSPTCLLTFFLRDDWLAWRRSGGFHRGLAASLNRADTGRFVCGGPRRSRLRFVMVTLAVAAFETRRGLWLLPPAFCLGQRPRRLRDGLGELRAITGG